SSRRRHTRFSRDWSSDVCSSDLATVKPHLSGVLCNSISIGRDIKELDVQGRPGLKKYEIVWRMLDWCADVAVDLTHTQVVIARIDGGCNFDGGEPSGGRVEGGWTPGNWVGKGNLEFN